MPTINDWLTFAEVALANPIDNHSIKHLSDALVVQVAYASLLPGLGVAQAGQLPTATGLGERRLEDALDALRTVFIGSASSDEVFTCAA